MKNALKTKIPFLFGIILSMFTISCEQDSNNIESSLNNDNELIEAIQTATNKSVIAVVELPSNSNAVLESEYSESYTEEALYAENLGYEVAVRRNQGSQVGERNQIYFDSNGNELKSANAEQGERKRQGQRQGSGDDKGQGEKGKDRHECFDLVFPLSFVMPDGIEITITDKEALKESVQTFYQANVGVEERFAIVFPVDVILADGTSQTLTSEDEIQALHTLCSEGIGNGNGQKKGRDQQKGQGQKGSCFNLVLPVTHIMPDGTEIVVSDSSERTLIQEWYDANPDADSRPMLLFPVDVIFTDGSIQTIASQEEMIAIREACKEQRQEKGKCFEVEFPITHIMPDGTEIIAEDAEDKDAIKAWYTSNPDVKERPELLFPITIVYSDGSTISVNDRDELKVLRKSCKDENNE